MDDKKSSGYEDFRETASDFAEERGHDLLTDPEADARLHAEAESQAGVTQAGKLKSFREQRGFTVEELARQVGISQDKLAALESGEALLPLGQMIKLSKALSLRMTDVISTGEEAFTIVRADSRTAVSRFGKSKQEDRGYEYESLAPGKKDRAMEPFIVTLQPASHDELSSHDGQEFIYVLEGEMEVVIGETHEVLRPGDAVYYDSTRSHLVRAYGDKPAKILAVLTS